MELTVRFIIYNLKLTLVQRVSNGQRKMWRNISQVNHLIGGIVSNIIHNQATFLKKDEKEINRLIELAFRSLQNQ